MDKTRVYILSILSKKKKPSQILQYNKKWDSISTSLLYQSEHCLFLLGSLLCLFLWPGCVSQSGYCHHFPLLSISHGGQGVYHCLFRVKYNADLLCDVVVLFQYFKYFSFCSEMILFCLVAFFWCLPLCTLVHLCLESVQQRFLFYHSFQWYSSWLLSQVMKPWEA